MKYTGKESDLTLARLERFLSIPFPSGLGAILFVTGAGIAVLGFGLWMVTSNWYSLLGGNMVYLGLLFFFLGVEVKSNPSRLPLTPLVGLLGWFVIRRLFSLSLILEYRSGIEVLWPYRQFDFIGCSAKAELVGALGMCGFWCGWRLARRGREVRGVEPLVPPVDRSIWGAYVISLLIYGLNVFYPLTIGRLGAFGGQLIGLSGGVAFIMAIMGSVTRPTFSLLGSVLLMLPFNVQIMTYGMKSAFIFPFLPAFHALLLRSFRWPIVLFLSIIMPFMLLFVFPYVNAYRNEVWNAKREVKANEFAKMVWHDVGKTGYRESARDSFEQLQGRYSSIGVTGAIVNFVNEEGYLGPLFLQNLSYGLIPRLLWPGKPAYEPAAWFSDKLFGVTTTATALFLPTEWFWMFGWLGVFFGLALTGYVYAWLHRYFLLNSLRGPVFWAGWFLLFSFIGQVEEVRSNTTVMMPFLLFAAVWSMHVMARLVTFSFGERLEPNAIRGSASPGLRRTNQDSGSR